MFYPYKRRINKKKLLLEIISFVIPVLIFLAWGIPFLVIPLIVVEGLCIIKLAVLNSIKY